MTNEFIGLEQILNESVYYRYSGTYRNNDLSTEQILNEILKQLDRIGLVVYQREIVVLDQQGNFEFNENDFTFVFLKAAVKYNHVNQEVLLVLPEAIYRYNGNETWTVCSQFSAIFLEKLGMTIVQ